MRAFAFAFAFALVLLFLLARPAWAADESHRLAVQMEWSTLGYHAPFYLALEKGWYRDAGLEISITPGSGTNTTVQLIASGKGDVGHAALSSVAVARTKGVPVVAIASFFRTGDICLLVPNDSPIRAPADMKGKRIIATAASFEAPYVDSFLAKGGLGRGDVTLLNIDFAARNAIYARGEADAIFGTPVGSGVQLEKMRPSRCLLFGDYGLNLPGFGMFATPAMLQRKGPAIRALASITAGAWTYATANERNANEAVDAIQKARAGDRLDRDQLMKQLQASVRFLHSGHSKNMPIGLQTEADWRDAIAVMESAKVIGPGTRPADYYTNDYLDQALIRRIGGR